MESVVVIPTYNEAKNIGRLIEGILALNLNLSIVVVDDSSPDNTAGIVEGMRENDDRIHLVRRTAGKSFGGSYRDGFSYALNLRPEYIFQMDADLSHSPEFIPDFLKHIPENDLLIGSRYMNGLRIMNWSIGRLALSLLANRYIRFILGLPFEDCTSGYRCWKADALAELRLNRISSRGYAFLVEMAYMAYKKKFAIMEVPIVFVEREQGDSKMTMKLVIESALLPWCLLFRNLFSVELKPRSANTRKAEGNP